MSPEPNIWSSLPLPTILTDHSGQILAANPATEYFLNRSERTLRKITITELCDGPDLYRAYEKMRSGHTALVLNDALFRIGGGGERYCQMHISLDATRVLVTLVPHTDDPTRIRGRAAKAAKSAIGMAEMLAHEIKNPLAGITGAAQLLSMSLPEEQQDLTEMIVSETRRVSKLLAQVEDFGNLMPPATRPVNLHDILDRARQSAQLGFAAEISIEELYDPSLPEAQGDPDQLLQVFLNLLKNAAEALKDQPDPRITLRTYFDGIMRVRLANGALTPAPLQVEIRDNGPGIPVEMMDVLFDPFISGKENGTGLGLALVSKIVSDHAGWVGMTSVPGATVFKVALPIAGHEGE